MTDVPITSDLKGYQEFWKIITTLIIIVEILVLSPIYILLYKILQELRK